MPIDTRHYLAEQFGDVAPGTALAAVISRRFLALDLISIPNSFPLPCSFCCCCFPHWPNWQFVQNENGSLAFLVLLLLLLLQLSSAPLWSSLFSFSLRSTCAQNYQQDSISHWKEKLKRRVLSVCVAAALRSLRSAEHRDTSFSSLLSLSRLQFHKHTSRQARQATTHGQQHSYRHLQVCTSVHTSEHGL